MRSAATPPAFVTSVITLRDGKISAGRTYTDLKGHDEHPQPEAS
jgi:ketosteroid isomerase-like protein